MSATTTVYRGPLGCIIQYVDSPDLFDAWTVYRGPLGCIIQYVDSPDLFDAWDAYDEYQGGFTSKSRAMEALEDARDVHQRLINAYNNR